MIIVTNKLAITPVGTGKALEFTERFFDHLKNPEFKAIQMSLLRPNTGNRDEVLVLTQRFDSLADYDEADRKIAADSGYLKLVKEARDTDWFLGAERQIYYVIKTT